MGMFGKINILQEIKKASSDSTKDDTDNSSEPEDTATNYSMDDANTDTSTGKDGDASNTPEDDTNATDNSSEPEDTATDYSMDDGEIPDGTTDDQKDSGDTSASDTNGDDNSDTSDNTDSSDTGDADADYSMDGSGDDSNDATGDDNPDDTSSDEELSPDDGMKKIEDEMNKGLTDKEIDLRNKQLKSKYVEVYEIVKNISTRLESVPKTEDNMTVIDFINDKTLELKQIIYDYLNDTYDTQTYIKNYTNHQEYLTVLAGIKKLFDEIKPKNEDEKRK